MQKKPLDTVEPVLASLHYTGWTRIGLGTNSKKRKVSQDSKSEKEDKQELGEC